jgi:deazaflavin-dependent oxidoreductase (nitroreductase family)
MDADTRRGRTLVAQVRAHVVNPVVGGLLRSPAHRVLSRSVLLLAYTGRRSGVRHELPVGYAGLGDGFVVVAGQPDSKTWWRNFTGGAQPVTVTVAGRRRSCTARLLEPPSAERRHAVEAYRRRHARVPVQDTAPVLVLTPDDDLPLQRSAVRRRWTDLTPRQRTAVSVVGAVQLSLAVAAWADLATRRPAEVNGNRTTWAAVIAVNGVGPLAWFRWGRRPR